MPGFRLGTRLVLSIGAFHTGRRNDRLVLITERMGVPTSRMDVARRHRPVACPGSRLPGPISLSSRPTSFLLFFLPALLVGAYGHSPLQLGVWFLVRRLPLALFFYLGLQSLRVPGSDRRFLTRLDRRPFVSVIVISRLRKLTLLAS